MSSGYLTGFTIKGQDVEEEETTRAVQQILGIWFNRHCSLEQEARNYPGKRSQMAIDSTDYLCSLVFAITVSSDHCYLTEEISKQ